MRAEDRALLDRTQLFQGCDAEAMAPVLKHAFVQSLPKGAVLFNQGEEPDFLHVILQGRVSLVGRLGETDEMVVDFFDEGDSIIAPAVMLRKPYLMTAKAVSDARILMLPGDVFRDRLQACPSLSLAASLMLARYWRRLVRQIMELKLRTGPERLAAYLLTLTPVLEGSAKVTLKEERRLVAGRLGMTPETLSRAFADLARRGLIGRGTDITIPDVAALRAYCRADEFVDERE